MAGKQLPHTDLVSSGLPKKGENQSPNDQVTTDLKKAKELRNNFLGKVGESVTPVISKQGKKVDSFTAPIKNLVDKSLLSKLMRIGLIILLIGLFLYITSLILKTVNESGDQSQISVPTPTIAPYHPFNPSIYAEDEAVLQMEEDIKILDRELSTSLLKETILTPPVLDFDVDFEE